MSQNILSKIFLNTFITFRLNIYKTSIIYILSLFILNQFYFIQNILFQQDKKIIVNLRTSNKGRVKGLILILYLLQVYLHE